MKLAIVQMRVGMNKAQNLASAKAQIAQAARSGADMVALPEMFCCPYANFYFVQNAEPKGGAIWTAMSEAAKENNVYLIAGSMPERDGVHLYNTSFVFDRQGNQIARHRKMHLFDIDIHGRQKFCESDTFEAGYEPKPEDINIEGLDIDLDTVKGLLNVDVELWKEEAKGIHEFYAKFGDKLPEELKNQLAALEERLANA